mmetsp:Transcript_24798/g.60868  ORF Transcript_24798/g.60868 Transcript_24798/m.60868 type:complete len:216 (-) Transcript_24798:717-1364(-)
MTHASVMTLLILTRDALHHLQKVVERHHPLPLLRHINLLLDILSVEPALLQHRTHPLPIHQPLVVHIHGLEHHGPARLHDRNTPAQRVVWAPLRCEFGRLWVLTVEIVLRRADGRKKLLNHVLVLSVCVLLVGHQLAGDGLVLDDEPLVREDLLHRLPHAPLHAGAAQPLLDAVCARRVSSDRRRHVDQPLKHVVFCEFRVEVVPAAALAVVVEA